MKAKLLTSFKIWLVIYPSITAALFFFGKHLSLLPLYKRTFILTFSLVPWMVFIAMPFLNFLVRQLSKKYHQPKLSS